MSNKTINDALKDLFLALGGDATELSDNTKISDYIEDLKGALKDAIDDAVSEALPTVTSSNNGQVLKVIEGAWGVGDALPTVTSSENGYNGEWSALNLKLDKNFTEQALELTVPNTNIHKYMTESVSELIDHSGSARILPDAYDFEEGVIIACNDGYEWTGGTIDFDNKTIDFGND